MDRLLPLLLVSVTALLAACGGGDGPTKPAAPAAVPKDRLAIVALGDSETTGAGDPTGRGWVGRYADLLRKEDGITAEVTNLAAEGKTSADLLRELRTDARTRAVVREAQVVLLGIGGADLNAGDDRLAAGGCRVTACYTPVLKAFAANFAAIVAEIRKLRGSNTTVLRSITQPNALTGAEDVIPPFLERVATEVGVYQARTANEAMCRVMAGNDGRCANILRAFNGPDGTRSGYDAGLLNHEDCCYLSGKGQQVLARKLHATGLAPLR